MSVEELEKKVTGIRAVTDAKLKFIREHTRLMDQAFEELKEVHDEDLDIIHKKIKELDQRLGGKDI